MSRQAITIRPNVPEDSYALLNVYADAICENLAAFYSNEQIAYLIKTKERALYSSLGNGHELLLGEVNDRIIGFGSVNKKESYVIDLVISPSYAGNNYARFILASLESILILNGAFRIHTNSPLNAVGFYKKMGYESLDCCTQVLGNDDYATVAMIAKTWLGEHYVK